MAIVDRVPEQCSLAQSYETASYKDCYSQSIEVSNTKSPARLFQEMLFPTPIWVSGLMRMRNFIVQFFGLKTDSELQGYSIQPDEKLFVGGNIGFFRITKLDDKEIVVTANDRHLNSSFSLFLREEEGAKTIFFTSVVNTKEKFGDLYMIVIAPFHRLIIKKMIKRHCAS